MEAEEEEEEGVCDADLQQLPRETDVASSPGEGDELSGKESVKVYPLRCYRLRKHGCLVLTWLIMGLYSEIIAPTLPALRRKLGVNYEEISRAVVGKSGGMLLGSMVGGVLHERYHLHTDLLMFLSHLLAATGTALVPFCPQLSLTGLALSLIGFAIGVINTGGNTMVMELWGDESGSPMQLLHCGVGVGALVVPQLVRLFCETTDTTGDESYGNSTNTWINTTMTENPNMLLGEMRRTTTTEIPSFIIGDNSAITGGSLQNASSDTMSDDPGEDYAGLRHAYLTVAGIAVAFSTVWLYYAICGLPKKFPVKLHHTNLKACLSPGSCFNGKRWYGFTVLFALFFFFFQGMGGEGAMGKFLFTFAIASRIGLSQAEAALLLSSYWLCYTLGRLIGFFFARLISVNKMITADLVGLSVCALVLARYAAESRIALWVFSCVLGACLSIIFPSGMVWANMNMHVNSMAVMTNMVGGSLGGLMYEYVAGALFQFVGPSALFFLMIAQSTGLAVTFVIMLLLVAAQKKKELKERAEQEAAADCQATSQDALMGSPPPSDNAK